MGAAFFSSALGAAAAGAAVLAAAATGAPDGTLASFFWPSARTALISLPFNSLMTWKMADKSMQAESERGGEKKEKRIDKKEQENKNLGELGGIGINTNR